MNELEFNRRCAARLGILYSCDLEVFVEHTDEAIPRVFDPYFDANDRNIIIEYLGIDTVLLTNMQKPKWQAIYGKGDREKIVIEVGDSIADAQRQCIASIFNDT